MPHRSAEEYVQRAKDAVALAEAETNLEAKAVYLQMAETWMLLAEQAMSARPSDPESES